MSGVHALLRQLIDIALVLSLTYAVLILIGERRTLWMVRGFVVLMLITAISRHLNLTLLSFFLTYLTLGASVAMAVLLQAEFRRFLERLGRGEVWRLLTPVGTSVPKSDDTIDELVDAVKELSQNRTGALIVLETDGTFDERDFSVPGVQLQAQVSKELIQTIFQTSTLLHDGAMLIQGAHIASAGAILPLSDRQASRQLGTRHRAAMGITERVENCLCIVVSEETGSISLAEQGILNRPLTSSRLRELLQERFSVVSDRDVGGGGWSRWPFHWPLRSRSLSWLSWLRLPSRKPPSRFSRFLKGSNPLPREDQGMRDYGNPDYDRPRSTVPLTSPSSSPSDSASPATTETGTNTASKNNPAPLDPRTRPSPPKQPGAERPSPPPPNYRDLSTPCDNSQNPDALRFSPPSLFGDFYSEGKSGGSLRPNSKPASRKF